jgi:hypothetical protein
MGMLVQFYGSPWLYQLQEDIYRKPSNAVPSAK